MTRSEMIKLLTNAASALKPLSGGATEHAESNPQLKVDVLQLILQILQAILAQQEQPTANGNGISADDAILLGNVGSILDSFKQDQANTPASNVQIGGLKIDILQIIIQVITGVLSQQKPPVQASILAPASEGEFHSEAVRPLVTSDSITYTIDTLGRLTKLTYASGHTITYNYDSVGNRTSVVTT